VRIRFLENISSSLDDRGDVLTTVAPWAGILGYQGVVVHGIFHSLLLKAASRCRDEAGFQTLLKEYRELKEAVHRQVEFGAPRAPPRSALLTASPVMPRFWRARRNISATASGTISACGAFFAPSPSAGSSPPNETPGRIRGRSGFIWTGRSTCGRPG